MDKESITKAYESAFFLKRDLQALIMGADAHTSGKAQDLLRQLKPIEHELEELHIETVM